MRHDDNKRQKAKIQQKLFLPDSELNFIIKLRHITTYLESGVTAARVEIRNF